MRDALLVRAIVIGVQQRNCNDVRRQRADTRNNVRDCPVRECHVHTLGHDPLPRANRVVARDEWRRMMLRQIVQRCAVLTCEVQHVGEALRRDQSNSGAGPLEQHVRRYGRAMHEPRHGDRVQQIERRGDTVALVRRRARYLAGGHRSLAIDGHQVGERAADVDADGDAGHAVRVALVAVRCGRASAHASARCTGTTIAAMARFSCPPGMSANSNAMMENTATRAPVIRAART